METQQDLKEKLSDLRRQLAVKEEEIAQAKNKIIQLKEENAEQASIIANAQKLLYN